MTKRELFEAVMTACETYNAKPKLVEALTALLKPKTAGVSVNLDEVTRKNEAGEIVEIQCSVSGVFLPATVEYFYEDKTGKGINGLKRLSRQAESIRKTHIRTVQASERAIVADILDSVISNEDGKAKIEELRASQPDFSTVGVIVATEPESAE